MDGSLDGSSALRLISLVLSDDNEPLKYQCASMCHVCVCVCSIPAWLFWQGAPGPRGTNGSPGVAGLAGPPGPMVSRGDPLWGPLLQLNALLDHTLLSQRVLFPLHLPHLSLLQCLNGFRRRLGQQCNQPPDFSDW